VVIVTAKGHTPTEMQKANYGMPSPHGYRTAMRLMRLAEKFQLPVITLVDTVGAWPTFECETLGQSEAIAANLTLMAGLRVPIVTVMVGEGGSGGALGLCMGNEIAMLSGGYFGVISPEGAASILGRYRDDKEKASQFPLDCQQLATAQCIYAHQLQQLGIVDHILWENEAETYLHFPRLQNQLRGFISSALARLLVLEPAQLVQQRYDKYRKMGQFALLDPTMRAQELARIKSITSAKPSRKAITSSTKAASISMSVAAARGGRGGGRQDVAPQAQGPTQYANTGREVTRQNHCHRHFNFYSSCFSFNLTRLPIG